MNFHVLIALTLFCCAPNVAKSYELFTLYPKMNIEYMGVLDVENGKIFKPDPDNLEKNKVFLYLVQDGGEVTVEVTKGEEIQPFLKTEGTLDYIIIMDILEAAKHKDLTPLESSDENTFKHSLTNHHALVVFSGDVGEKIALQYEAGGCDLESLPEYVVRDETKCQTMGASGSRFSSCEVQCERNYKLIGEPNIKCVKGKFYPLRPCGLISWQVKRCTKSLTGKCIYTPKELRKYYEENNLMSGLTEKELEALGLSQFKPADSEPLSEEDSGTSLAVFRKSKKASCKGFCKPEISCSKMKNFQRQQICFKCKGMKCKGPTSYN